MATRKPTSTLWKNINSSGGIIKGKWKVSRKVGEGAFGEIYAAVNIITLQSVAIKFELVDTKKQVLKIEVAVLRKLQSSESPYIASLITCGRFTNYNYMVMELLGNNVSEYRRQTPTGKFSVVTAMRLGLQMLDAVKSMHEMGFLHRDIKPSNFAMGLPPKHNTCFIIDFGLARRYCLPNGDVRPERDQTGFRGTARYASIYSHQSKDLGRRDDLWSVFYMMIELIIGELPWRRVKDKDQVGNMKVQHHKPELVENLPPQFLTFMNHLISLQFADRPDYDLIKKLFTEMLYEAGGNESSPFDWEKEETKHQIIRSVPSLYDSCVKQVLPNITTYEDKIQSVLSREVRTKLLNTLLKLRAPQFPENSLLALLMDSEASELDIEDHLLDDDINTTLVNKYKNLTKLNLSSVNDSQISGFLASNSETLEHLKLSMCPMLTCKTTRFLEQCTQLRSITIQNADKINDRHLEVVIRNCLYLKELKVIDCRKVKGAIFKCLVSRKAPVTALSSIDLSLCPISKKSFRAMVKFSSNLLGITLNPLVTNYTISSNEISALLCEARNLTQLDIATFRLELDPILVEIGEHCTKLVSFSIDGNGITDLGLQNVFQHCRNIRHLEFRYSENVTETTLQRIARQLPDIQTIKLHFMSKFFKSSISEHSISSLIKSSSHLQSLTLDKCLLLSSNCFSDSLTLSKLKILDISDCVNLLDEDLLHIILCCPQLTTLKINNLNQLDTKSLMMVASAPHIQELFIHHCVNFTDDSIIELLNAVPRLFIHLTRYSTIDLAGREFQVHCTNAQQIFDSNPNSFSHKILDRFRRSVTNANPMNNVF